MQTHASQCTSQSLHTRGLTLVELIAVLAIVSIIFGLVLPSTLKIKNRSEATASINWIIGAVNYTRHAAVTFRTMATLCPRHPDRLDCGGKWHNDLMIFADRNGNGRFNEGDEVLQIISGQDVDGTFKWRSFRNRQYLQITPFGYTNHQNGNFTYCPASRDLKLARQIVVNVQGRARVVHSRDEDGTRTDRKGKPLRC